MPRLSNCFFFSLAAWWRWRRHGAYWCVRICRPPLDFGIHWMVHYRGRFIHYEPLERQQLPWALIHKMLYRGAIRRRD